MKLQKSNHTILLVLEKGEDIVECITNFADDQLSVLNHMKLLADISLKQLFLQLLKSFLL